MDVAGSLRTYLQSQPSVTALTTNIYAGTLPRKIQKSATPPTAVVLRRAGGGALGRVNQFGDKRIDVDCYGADPKAASELFDAVYLVLKNMGTKLVGNVLFYWTVPTTDGSSGHDPQTTWPVTIGTFQSLVAELKVGLAPSDSLAPSDTLLPY